MVEEMPGPSSQTVNCIQSLKKVADLYFMKTHLYNFWRSSNSLRLWCLRIWVFSFSKSLAAEVMICNDNLKMWDIQMLYFCLMYFKTITIKKNASSLYSFRKLLVFLPVKLIQEPLSINLSSPWSALLSRPSII